MAPRPTWWVGAAGLAALLVTLLWSAGTFDTTNSGADPAHLDCPDTATYGQTISCSIAAEPDMVIDWGDGATETVGERTTVEHEIRTAGVTAVKVLAADHIASSDTVEVEPDLTVECGTTSDESQPIYELMPAAENGVRDVWDYVYTDEAGNRIEPGHADHPTDPGFTDLAPIVIDRVPRTGICHAQSEALDELGGDLYWMIESDWYVPSRTNFRSPLISLHGQWAGIQPGSATAFVTVNDLGVSERVGVYASGCT
jgi:hypothetical protein